MTMSTATVLLYQEWNATKWTLKWKAALFLLLHARLMGGIRKVWRLLCLGNTIAFSIKISSVNPADGHFSAISVENENTFSNKYYRCIISKCFGLSHTTWMHYFFLSMFTKWRISNWSLIGPFSSTGTGDQVNMWPEESRCIIAAVIFYSVRQCLFKKKSVCFINDANVVSSKMNDNPSADMAGCVLIRRPALHAPLLSASLHILYWGHCGNSSQLPCTGSNSLQREA